MKAQKTDGVTTQELRACTMALKNLDTTKNIKAFAQTLHCADTACYELWWINGIHWLKNNTKNDHTKQKAIFDRELSAVRYKCRSD
jgi:hypothetical protein